SVIADGNRLLAQTNYSQARAEFRRAGKLADALNDPENKKIAEDGELFANTVVQANATADLNEKIRLLREALNIRKDLKVQELLLAAQRRASVVAVPVPAVPVPAVAPGAL